MRRLSSGVGASWLRTREFRRPCGNLSSGPVPPPDLRQAAGGTFPEAFHDDIATVLSMVELARREDRFGTADLAEALGWAAHLFAEVPSAHRQTGYSNTKVVFGPGKDFQKANHLIAEFCIDILSYLEADPADREIGLSLPERLLESSMEANRCKDPEGRALSAGVVREHADAFLPTVQGIRLIAEFLARERPELVAEMDAFFADRKQAMAVSIEDVTLMLET